MLNIAICDDDIQTTGRMDMLLQEIAKQNFIDIEIEVFWNGKSLADAVAQGTYFDMWNRYIACFICSISVLLLL